VRIDERAIRWFERHSKIQSIIFLSTLADFRESIRLCNHVENVATLRGPDQSISISVRGKHGDVLKSETNRCLVLRGLYEW
jgi:hypothetical protein